MDYITYEEYNEIIGHTGVNYYDYDGFYINLDKMEEFEDDEDYFDNTLDMIDNMDNIMIDASDGIIFSLRELVNFDEDLIYYAGRKDGIKYLSSLIDHICSDGYKGE